MNILMTIDRNYIFQVETCVKSFARFKTKDGYDIYILHQKLQSEDINKLKNLESPQLHFHFIKIDSQYFQDFPCVGGYPIEMYFRLMAASFLSSDMDRILYLDPDIIVIKPLEQLYQTEFEDNIFIGTTHIDKLLTKMNAHRLGLKDTVPYINTGILLINLQALRKETKLMEKIEYFVANNKKNLRLPDQDVLTALFGHQVKLVDPLIYNLSDRTLAFHNMKNPSQMKDLDWVKKNTVIIHYCGKNKPWHSHYVGILKSFYEEVLS